MTDLELAQWLFKTEQDNEVKMGIICTEDIELISWEKCRPEYQEVWLLTAKKLKGIIHQDFHCRIGEVRERLAFKYSEESWYEEVDEWLNEAQCEGERK